MGDVGRREIEHAARLGCPGDGADEAVHVGDVFEHLGTIDGVERFCALGCLDEFLDEALEDVNVRIVVPGIGDRDGVRLDTPGVVPGFTRGLGHEAAVRADVQESPRLQVPLELPDPPSRATRFAFHLREVTLGGAIVRIGIEVLDGGRIRHWIHENDGAVPASVEVHPLRLNEGFAVSRAANLARRGVGHQIAENS